jgi:leucyl/phenylalanyl-tRNA--protein transferase
MPIYALSSRLAFPPPEHAEDGLLAVGGDLRPERLLLGYRLGIFPWYEEGSPILWHSPDPRCVLVVERLHVGRTLKKVLRRGTYTVTFDTDFRSTIRACKEAPRPGQNGTWITDDMEEAYVRLHEMGYAHSVEVRSDGSLVGGLYGVSLGRVFFGESMFSVAPNASKVAVVALTEKISGWGFHLIDAQVMTQHTEALGAEEWPRALYLDLLAQEVALPTRRGSWALDDPPTEAPSVTFP